MACDTAILFLHEIYGINAHMREEVNLYKSLGFDTHLIDFYHNESPKLFEYEQAPAAYAAFFDKVGFDRARNQVIGTAASLRNQYQRVFAIGYSIGATVAWRCSDSTLLDGCVCYYGSRIRDYLSVDPLCPVLHLNPTEEPSYDTSPVYSALSKKKNTSVYVFSAPHGFADRFYEHYDEPSAAKSRLLAERFLKNSAARIQLS